MDTKTDRKTVHTHIPTLHLLYSHAICYHHNVISCGVNVFSHKQPLSVSNLPTKTQVDTYSNNDDNVRYFAIFRKQNHSTLEIHKTKNTTTPVQDNVHSCLLQMSYLTSTTSLKLPPSVKEFFSE